MLNKPILYGVFVAVDEYGENVSNLSGCKNDIKAYKSLLQDVYKNNLNIDFEKNVQELADANATYDKVIKAFNSDTFQNLKKDDIFLFIYSGHGCRERQAPQFNAIYPEKYSETLVLHDSREKNGKDLADKEIAILLNRIGKKCDNIIVIFDCCHAGSGTRNINDIKLGATRQVEADDSNELLRSAYTKEGIRKYDSYINRHYADNFPNEPKIPHTKHILLAACDEKEKARELKYPNSIGAFTKYLTETIRQNPTENYVSLFNVARTKMKQDGILQNPRINNYHYFNAYGSFLLNEKGNRKYLDLLRKNDEWEIKIGAIHGMPTDREVFVEIFNGNQIISKGKVESIFPNYSRIELVDAINTSQTNLKAVLTSPLAQPILIDNLSDEVGNQRLINALDKLTPINFKIENRIKDAQYSIKITNDRASILDNDKNKEIIAYSGNGEDEIFRHLFSDLEDISRWEHKLAIKNKNLRFDPDEVEFIFTNKNSGVTYNNQELVEIELAENEYDEFELEYELSIVNKTRVPIKCTLLYFSPSYGIDQWSNNITVPHKIGQNRKVFEIEEGYDALGIPETKNETCDIFKIFISTEEYIEALALTQKDLPLINEFKENGVIICNKNADRGNLREVIKSKKYRKQWFTKEIRVKTIKRKLSFGNESIKVSDKIQINAPTNLKGDILTRVIPKNSKSLDTHQIVNQFFNIDDVEILSFESEKSLSGVPNCIEIKNLQNEEILIENPMTISISNEGDGIIIPLSYDGEYFIPLDCKWSEDGQYNFDIHYLPKDNSSKSFWQSCRLFFAKIDVSKIDDDTHILKWVDTKTEYELDTLPEIKNKIDNSQNPLLLIHGILGNTKQMVKLANELVEEGRYDAVLTFNYENLNTPIDATAGKLLENLKLIGISKSKKITILAHSMGGLVSRSMIEQMNGREIVKKLVLAGTPNMGSKFASIGGAVFQWLPLLFFTANLFRGLSNLKKIFALANGKFKSNKTLNQMTWGHQDLWLQNLSNANDPKIPYHIIHGNLTDYLEDNADKKRLINKVYKLGGKLFYAAPLKSDLIVSEQSMKGVPEKRNPKYHSTEVPSIHMTYFQDEKSIQEIKKVL